MATTSLGLGITRLANVSQAITAWDTKNIRDVTALDAYSETMPSSSANLV